MAIPNMFFIDGKLYKKIKLVKSDDSVVAFDFEEEARVWLPIAAVEKNCGKAFTVGETSKLIGIERPFLKDLIKRQKVPAPHMSYNTSTYAPGQYYIDEADLMNYRDAAWEVQPKNRFGEPFHDKIVSKSELQAKLFRSDDRNFVVRDGDVLQIFSA